MFSPSLPGLAGILLPTVFLLCLTVVPSAGGYGAVLFALHPLLTIMGTLACWPLGLLVLRQQGLSVATRGVLHASLQSGGALLLAAGYGAAFYVHSAKGDAHLPFEHADPTRPLHVICGLLVLLGACAQSLSGFASLLCPREARPWTARLHAVGGLPLFLASAANILFATLIRYNDRHNPKKNGWSLPVLMAAWAALAICVRALLLALNLWPPPLCQRRGDFHLLERSAEAPGRVGEQGGDHHDIEGGEQEEQGASPAAFGGSLPPQQLPQRAVP